MPIFRTNRDLLPNPQAHRQGQSTGLGLRAAEGWLTAAGLRLEDVPSRRFRPELVGECAEAGLRGPRFRPQANLRLAEEVMGATGMSGRAYGGDSTGRVVA